MKRFFVLTFLFLAASTTFAQDTGDQLWHHRNLGKAFYENPATQYEAIGEFVKRLGHAIDVAEPESTASGLVAVTTLVLEVPTRQGGVVKGQPVGDPE